MVRPAQPRLTARLPAPRSAAAVLALAVLALAIWWSVWPPAFAAGLTSATAMLAVAWLAFAAAVWCVRRVPTRGAVALIVAGSVALPLLAASAPPRVSDDVNRYAWDGRVQAAGVDPYRYAPASPHLVGLRDPVLWPDTGYCVTPGQTDQQTGEPLAPGCTVINRPTVHTIYPPVAQAYFLAVHLLSGPGAGVRALQVAGALCAIAVTILLLIALPRLGIDPRQAAIWAWCPTVVLEAGNNAHIDVLAAGLAAATLVTASVVRTHRGSAAAGVLWGLSVAAKIFPVLLGPALLRRRPVAIAGAAVAAVAAVYLPHVLAVGGDVLGYLPGYLSEEGYADGSRFALLSPVLPGWATPPAAVVLLAVIALGVLRFADPDRPWRGSLIMTGSALLVATPTYPWYATLLVVLVAMDGRVEWLAIAVAGYLAWHAHDLHQPFAPMHRFGYGAAALIVVGAEIVRRRRRRTTTAARVI